MTATRIAIVGGIFDKSPEYRAQRAFTPETVLAEGLRTNGWEVDAVGHRTFDPALPYDIVHIHHIGRGAVRMALSASNAPLVFSSHDGTMMGDYPVSRRRRLVSRLIVERADALVALSEAERDSDARRFGTARPRQEVIPNGFPARTFSYAPPPAPPTRPSVLFVGQLIPLKGVDVLLRAFARLNPDADLLLAYQNSALEADYRQEVQTLGIADRVQFLGMQSSAELAERYGAASVLVSASFADALPSVVIEALMCGTPVIGTSVGGVPEILTGGRRSGGHHIVPPGDIDRLVVALRERLAYPASAAEREATSADAIARYSPATMVAAHEALYRDLLTSGGPARRNRRMSRIVNPGVAYLLARAEPIMVGRGLLS